MRMRISNISNAASAFTRTTPVHLRSNLYNAQLLSRRFSHSGTSKILEAVRHPITWWRENNTKVKQLFKQYGYLAVATYLGVYVCTLASLYGCVKLGFIKGPDVNTWINNWRVKKALTDKEIHLPPGFVDFATAWILTKTTEPIRLVVTIPLVPIIARRAPASVLRFFRVTTPQSSSTVAAATAKETSKGNTLL